MIKRKKSDESQRSTHATHKKMTDKKKKRGKEEGIPPKNKKRTKKEQKKGKFLKIARNANIFFVSCKGGREEREFTGLPREKCIFHEKRINIHEQHYLNKNHH